MSSDSISKQVFVNDGDTIVVIAKTQGPTVSDPCDAYPYVSQAYRVVASGDGTLPGATLALVPLGPRPTRVSQNEIDQFLAREEKELKEALVFDVVAFIRDFVEESGWELDAPVIVSDNEALNEAVRKAREERAELRRKWDGINHG